MLGINSIANIMVGSLFLGAEIGLHFFIFVAAETVILFTRRDQIWLSVSYILVTSVAIFVCEVQFEEGLIHPFPQDMMGSMLFSNILGTIAMVTAVAWYYRGLVYQAERDSKSAHEQTRSILNTVLPGSIAKQLEDKADQVIAEQFDSITVLFADIVDFTARSKDLTAEEVVGRLDRVFSAFDEMAKRHNLEKIKTIGDCYMLVGGAPEKISDHADRVVGMAMEMQAASADFSKTVWPGFQVRIGIHSGSAVAGVIGRMKYSYDVWGDTVNIASRLEELCAPGEILLSDETRALLQTDYPLGGSKELTLKGRGSHKAWVISP